MSSWFRGSKKKESTKTTKEENGSSDSTVTKNGGSRKSKAKEKLLDRQKREELRKKRLARKLKRRKEKLAVEKQQKDDSSVNSDLPEKIVTSVLAFTAEEVADETESHILEQARWKQAKNLGIDPLKDEDMMYLVDESLQAKLPKGWRKAASADGREYYYNKKNRKTQWTHPSDEKYKERVRKIKEDRVRLRVKRMKSTENKDIESNTKDLSNTKDPKIPDLESESGVFAKGQHSDPDLTNLTKTSSFNIDREFKKEKNVVQNNHEVVNSKTSGKRNGKDMVKKKGNEEKPVFNDKWDDWDSEDSDENAENDTTNSVSKQVNDIADTPQLSVNKEKTSFQKKSPVLNIPQPKVDFTE